MRFNQYTGSIQTLYHYTSRENAEKIMREKTVKAGRDGFCFFSSSLADARMLFRMLMEQPAVFIDDDLKIRERIPQKPQDYVILKIETENDGQFYHFVWSRVGFNPYDYSLLHQGALRFFKAEVIRISEPCFTSSEGPEVRFPAAGKRFLKLRRITAAGLSAALLFQSMPIMAAGTSWLDSGNYDTSWYTESGNNFELSAPQQLAGLSYLVNSGNDMSGKNFVIRNNIDLTAYEWVSIPESFQGTIDGAHKVMIALLSDQKPFTREICEFTNISITYTNNATQVSYSVAPSYTVTIPESVTLGENVTISVEDVVLEKGKQVEVALTGTSGEDNAFTLKSPQEATVEYAVQHTDGTPVILNEAVLTVSPETASGGSTTLLFAAPDKENITYAGKYTGTVFFTVSIRDTM